MNWEIPKTYLHTIAAGDDGIAVWALQRCLNSFTDLGFKTAEDGEFGPRTEANVKAYQGMVKLEADGVVGPQTQIRLAQSVVIRADAGKALPRNLLLAIIRGESGGQIAAVNWSVAGGVDCGYTQRRVLIPYTESEALAAFDSFQQINRLKNDLSNRFVAFMREDTVRSRSDGPEYAWRLATLAHNWPYGASRLADGYALSDREASWVPPGTKFPDGEPVNTYAEWAKFYSMGSRAHNWPGLMTKDTFEVPTSG